MDAMHPYCSISQFITITVYAHCITNYMLGTYTFTAHIISPLPFPSLYIYPSLPLPSSCMQLSGLSPPQEAPHGVGCVRSQGRFTVAASELTT